MTTSPLVSMAGSAGTTGGGVTEPGVAGVGGGGERIVLMASMRLLTAAASGAPGSRSRYFWKNSDAFSRFLAFSNDTAALKRKAGKGLRVNAAKKWLAASSKRSLMNSVC